MSIVHSNNAVSTLIAPVSTTDTTIVVTFGEGNKFPIISGTTNSFYVTVEDRSIGILEIMLCTARSSNNLTVTRAQQGTTAHAFSAGTNVSNRVTAGYLNSFESSIQEAITDSEAASIAAATALVTATEAQETADAAKISADAATAAIGETQEDAAAAQAAAALALSQATAAQAAATNAETAALSAQGAAEDAVVAADGAQDAAAAASASADAALAGLANKVDTSDPRLSNARSIAAGNYGAFVVDNSAVATLVGAAVRDTILAFPTVDATAVGNYLLQGLLAVHSAATFQVWREGTSNSRLMTPKFWHDLLAPQPFTVSGATHIVDYGDAEEPDIDLGKARTLVQVLNVSANCTASLKDVTGSLIGRDIWIRFVNAGTGTKLCDLVTGNGITVTKRLGAFNPNLGAATGDWLMVGVHLASSTEAYLMSYAAKG